MSGEIEIECFYCFPVSGGLDDEVGFRRCDDRSELIDLLVEYSAGADQLVGKGKFVDRMLRVDKIPIPVLRRTRVTHYEGGVDSITDGLPLENGARLRVCRANFAIEIGLVDFWWSGKKEVLDSVGVTVGLVVIHCLVDWKSHSGTGSYEVLVGVDGADVCRHFLVPVANEFFFLVVVGINPFDFVEQFPTHDRGAITVAGDRVSKPGFRDFLGSGGSEEFGWVFEESALSF